jgi:chromosome segregation ATPase
MIFFGRQGGPARTVLAFVGVAVLGLLSFVIFNLNNRLDNQQAANEASIEASSAIVKVNDKLTERLQQLTDLTVTAQSALDETSALAPLLTKLQKAIAPAAAMVTSGTQGAQTSNAQLARMEAVLVQLKSKVLPLVESAGQFGGQGDQLLSIVRGLVGDLRGAVAAAKKINANLPLPG